VNFFQTPGADQYAFPLYTMEDAARLKEHVLKTFEAVDKNPSLIDDGALNFCVVGHGGRIPVGPDLQVKDHPGVFAIGDIATMTDGETGNRCPAWVPLRSRLAITSAKRSSVWSRAKRPNPLNTLIRARWLRSVAARR
jgi:NADH dehydrogenase FAD-containing subunit